jgi:HSP20 family protein
MLGTSLTRRTPFQQAFAADTLSRFLGADWADDVLRRVAEVAPTWSGSYTPAVDYRQTDEGHHLEIDLPGLTKDDVDITVEDNVLTISGERRNAGDPGANGYHRIERWYGSFQRSFTLPGQVDPSRIQATFSNGVLSIVLPKAEEARRRKVEIR